jgi:hypothetical protein
MKDKEYNVISKIKKLDAKLADLNFDVTLALKNINISTTSDRDDPFISHQTLLQFGIDNQKIDLFKEDYKCKASVFGIYVHALNSFEMLYMFA